ncbi:aminoglycoside 3'-phosphotransferase [Labedella populi]|uniref:Aminoglycoside 3'-phosphotransferase n=1 Tax=Labedella populi TaxID=2498850 RepID=A0A3S4E288_9MICO|nr:aminoglycoside 3'-phosphotransferase [Labedella populi]RWZ64664.1 aminoglycoside 3'-phosphotransferase [Labedella populi]
MTIPRLGGAVPHAVLRHIGDARVTPVWENADGGLTYRLDGPHGGRHVKWGPPDYRDLFEREARRLEWASEWIRVPRVLELDVSEPADGVVLVTETIEALSAVDPSWIARPEIAVRACGAGLRRLHDSLPAGDCPFDWSVASRIDEAIGRGVRVPDDVLDPPPIDRLVVCHGDPCVPNTLLDADGAPVAHVDLGMLGLADRWADIAVGSMSIEWNYGPGVEHLFFEGYGITPDHALVDYYRRLWNST